MRNRTKDKHLPPCVYLKHGRYWYVKRNKWHDLGTDLAGALAAYAAKLETPQGTMPDFLDRAFAHHRTIKKLSDATLDQYTIALAALKRHFKQFSPDTLRPRAIYKMLDIGASSPNMTNRKLSLLRTLFDYAVRWEEAERNPCIGIKRLPEAKRKRYITDDEYAAIYAKAGPRLQVIMDLQYLTGQRINDVLKMSRKQITEEGIMLKPQKTKNSSGVEMLLRWSPELRAVVERAKALNGNVQALTLLHNRRGKAPDYRTVLLQWNKAAAAAGVVDAKLNDQRAKSATDAKRQGKNPRALLGHTSDAMTERYIRQHDTPVVDGPSMPTKVRKS